MEPKTICIIESDFWPILGLVAASSTGLGIIIGVTIIIWWNSGKKQNLNDFKGI